MVWEISYRIKGDNRMLREKFELHFINKSEVKKWWMNVRGESFVNCVGNNIVGGKRQDREWVNAKLLNE